MISKQIPHRRFNPLTGEWVLVSPHRTDRPWQGRVEPVPAKHRLQHDPECYLCPGNSRADGKINPDYPDTFVFTNDYPALLPDAGEPLPETDKMFHVELARGTCRVLCFSPRHDLTLPQMALPDIRKVVDVWAAQVEELGDRYSWVQVFENKGEMMGCSNPHPHGQVWACDFLPTEILKEDRGQKTHFEAHRKPLLVDYLEQEMARGDRVVLENEDWVVVVPFWALWPFETLLLPRRPVSRMPDLSGSERENLAVILKQLLTRYDKLFGVSFPYSMGWHGAPMNGQTNEHWQLHAHFYPPLLRSATVKKFMVGFEMLAEPQRDLLPEESAARLRSVSERATPDL